MSAFTSTALQYSSTSYLHSWVPSLKGTRDHNSWYVIRRSYISTGQRLHQQNVARRLTVQRSRGSATVEPSVLLHLDIYHDSVHTVEDALNLFSAPESVEGYRIGKADNIVTARKSIQIQVLPKIMILHLVRFGYGRQGCTKLLKPIHFSLELTLARDLLVSPSTRGRKYELVATTTHHGRDPSNGH